MGEGWGWNQLHPRGKGMGEVATRGEEKGARAGEVVVGPGRVGVVARAWVVTARGWVAAARDWAARVMGWEGEGKERTG